MLEDTPETSVVALLEKVGSRDASTNCSRVLKATTISSSPPRH